MTRFLSPKVLLGATMATLFTLAFGWRYGLSLLGAITLIEWNERRKRRKRRHRIAQPTEAD
jgi:hypothetical protein